MPTGPQTASGWQWRDGRRGRAGSSSRWGASFPVHWVDRPSTGVAERRSHRLHRSRCRRRRAGPGDHPGGPVEDWGPHFSPVLGLAWTHGGSELIVAAAFHDSDLESLWSLHRGRQPRLLYRGSNDLILADGAPDGRLVVSRRTGDRRSSSRRTESPVGRWSGGTGRGSWGCRTMASSRSRSRVEGRPTARISRSSGIDATRSPPGSAARGRHGPCRRMASGS